VVGGFSYPEISAIFHSAKALLGDASRSEFLLHCVSPGQNSGAMITPYDRVGNAYESQHSAFVGLCSSPDLRLSCHVRDGLLDLQLIHSLLDWQLLEQLTVAALENFAWGCIQITVNLLFFLNKRQWSPEPGVPKSRVEYRPGVDVHEHSGLGNLRQYCLILGPAKAEGTMVRRPSSDVP
jgi:hypothetical protein